jgi:hypothetical protein
VETIMPKHHLPGYDDGEILLNLKYALACLRRQHPRSFIGAIRLTNFYNRHFPEVPCWYLRSFICEPYFKLVDRKGWVRGC